MKQVFKRTITVYKYDVVIMNEDRTTHQEFFYFHRKFKSEKAAIAAIKGKLPNNLRCLAADLVEESKTTRCMDLDTFIAHSHIEDGACDESAN